MHVKSIVPKPIDNLRHMCFLATLYAGLLTRSVTIAVSIT